MCFTYLVHTSLNMVYLPNTGKEKWTYLILCHSMNLEYYFKLGIYQFPALSYSDMSNGRFVHTKRTLWWVFKHDTFISWHPVSKNSLNKTPAPYVLFSKDLIYIPHGLPTGSTFFSLFFVPGVHSASSSSELSSTYWNRASKGTSCLFT